MSNRILLGVEIDLNKFIDVHADEIPNLEYQDYLTLYQIYKQLNGTGSIDSKQFTSFITGLLIQKYQPVF